MKIECLQHHKIEDISKVWNTIREYDDLKLDGVVYRDRFTAVADKYRGLCFEIPTPLNYRELVGNAFSKQSGKTGVEGSSYALEPLLRQGMDYGEFIRLDYTNDVIQQLSALCRINRVDLEKEAEKYPDIAAKRINAWLRDHATLNYKRKKERFISDVKHLVRAYVSSPNMRDLWGTPFGVIRALRSDQFKLGMDVSDLLGVLLKVLADKKDKWEKVSVDISVSDSRCYFVVNNYSLQRMNAVGDPYCASFIGSTSDVGSGSLCLESRAVKLACMNGMKTGHAVRKAHLGKKLDLDLQKMLSQRTFQMQQQTLMSELYDVMCFCFEENSFDKVIEKVNENLGIAVEDDQAKNVFEAVQVSLGVAEDVKDQLFAQFCLEQSAGSQNKTKDGVIQAVTHLGRQIGINKNYNDAIPFEEVGGKLYAMDNELFSHLVQSNPKRGAKILSNAVLA